MLVPCFLRFGVSVWNCLLALRVLTIPASNRLPELQDIPVAIYLSKDIAGSSSCTEEIWTLAFKLGKEVQNSLSNPLPFFCPDFSISNQQNDSQPAGGWKTLGNMLLRSKVIAISTLFSMSTQRTGKATTDALWWPERFMVNYFTIALTGLSVEG